jgi:hypothetical protein
MTGTHRLGQGGGAAQEGVARHHRAGRERTGRTGRLGRRDGRQHRGGDGRGSHGVERRRNWWAKRSNTVGGGSGCKWFRWERPRALSGGTPIAPPASSCPRLYTCVAKYRRRLLGCASHITWADVSGRRRQAHRLCALAPRRPATAQAGHTLVWRRRGREHGACARGLPFDDSGGCCCMWLLRFRRTARTPTVPTSSPGPKPSPRCALGSAVPLRSPCALIAAAQCPTDRLRNHPRPLPITRLRVSSL